MLFVCNVNSSHLLLLLLRPILQVWFRRPLGLEGSFEAQWAHSRGFIFLQCGLHLKEYRKMVPGIESECCDHIDLSHARTGFLHHYFSFVVVFNMNYNFMWERRVTALSHTTKVGRVAVTPWSRSSDGSSWILRWWTIFRSWQMMGKKHISPEASDNLWLFLESLGFCEETGMAHFGMNLWWIHFQLVFAQAP